MDAHRAFVASSQEYYFSEIQVKLHSVMNDLELHLRRKSILLLHFMKVVIFIISICDLYL